MTPEQWQQMTAVEQANFWLAELDSMIHQALTELHYEAGNPSTLVLPGMTTVVGRKTS